MEKHVACFPSDIPSFVANYTHLTVHSRTSGISSGTLPIHERALMEQSPALLLLRSQWRCMSRVTCHVSRVTTIVTMLSTLQHHNICDLVIPLSQRWAPLGAEKISSYLSLSCLLDNLVFCKTTR